MAFTLTKKMKWGLALLPVALILLFVGYEAVRVWWYRGYSKGSRTGVVVKVTEKGPPGCKYLEGEMKVGGTATMTPETWLFSVDDDSPTNAVVANRPQGGGEEAAPRHARLPAGHARAVLSVHRLAVSAHHQGR